MKLFFASIALAFFAFSPITFASLYGSGLYGSNNYGGVVGPDTTAPSLADGAPSGTLAAGTVSTALSLTTNESATCRYSTTANTAYASMVNTFSTSNGTAHTANVSGLSNSTTYTYYVRCTDGSANATSNDYTISFDVATPNNTAPLADAGSDASITLPVNDTTLSGSGTDNDGAIVAYAWTKLSGPVSADITNPTSASTTVTGLTAGTYVFRLTVTDNDALTDTDDVTVVVNPEVVSNESPRASYGYYIAPVNTSRCTPGTAYNPLTGAPCPTSPTTPVVQYVFMNDFSIGTRNDDIKRLQSYLNTHGFPVAPSGVGSRGFETNYFGLATKAALIKYQKAHNIPGTGFFGPVTRTYINKIK